MSDVVPIAKSDGLPARFVKPHTREKFYLHRGYCSIFNASIKDRWIENRGYLELFAGSGLAIDYETGDEIDGCPLQAATVADPGFDRLAFVEADEELAEALERRLLARGIDQSRARVFPGDANDPAVLADALAFLPNPGLVFAAEPLLGSLFETGGRKRPLALDRIDWLIAGGESGAGYRPVHIEWLRELRDACDRAGVKFFFKQWGGRTPKSGGRELDGETHDAIPAVRLALAS